MSHPSLDRITAAVHGAADPSVEAHLVLCPGCAGTADRVRAEARAIARGLADEDRLAALKASLLRAAPEGAPAAPARRASRGLFWQIPAAAAVLVTLVFVLFSPGPRHRLTAGRVALEDGREIAAPVEFAGARRWTLRAVDKASLRLSEGSTVELAPGARLGLSPAGERRVQPDLASGEASFAIAAGANRMIVCTPAGRAQTAQGTFSMRIVSEENGGTPMKGMIAGALVTVLSGSLSLSNPGGTAEASPGQTVALAQTQAPLLLASQDRQEELLRKLEQLAARIAKLEDEIAQLEARNKALKAQVNGAGAAGAATWSTSGQGHFRVIQGGTSGATVIIEDSLKGAEKVERRDK